MAIDTDGVVVPPLLDMEIGEGEEVSAPTRQIMPPRPSGLGLFATWPSLARDYRQTEEGAVALFPDDSVELEGRVGPREVSGAVIPSPVGVVPPSTASSGQGSMWPAPGQRLAATQKEGCSGLGLSDAMVRDFAPGASVRYRQGAPAGWRGLVWRATMGHVVVPESARARRSAERLTRIQTPVAACAKIAFASGKGGVGKTTATLLCGTALSLLRGDRIVAMDANPDAGSLGWRVDRRTDSTLSDLLRDADTISRYGDVRSYMSQSDSRLEVLASANNPSISMAMGDGEYRRAVEIIEQYYSMLLMDLGTGLVDGGTQAILGLASQVVVITSPSVDSGRIADFTLDFIEKRDPEKARAAIVVINNVRKDSAIDVDALDAHFASRAAAVVRVPWDAHLSAGDIPRWELLQPQTREAYLDLAALVAAAAGTGAPG